LPGTRAFNLYSQCENVFTFAVLEAPSPESPRGFLGGPDFSRAVTAEIPVLARLEVRALLIAS